jgi:hypothetical protein
MKNDTTEEVDEKEEKEPSSGEGVKLPEEFQQEVYELIQSADSKEKLSYIRDCCYQKEDEMRKAEMKKDSKGKKVPDEYSTADMPSR